MAQRRDLYARRLPARRRVPQALRHLAGGVRGRRVRGIGINVFRPEVDRPVQGRNVPSTWRSSCRPLIRQGHFVSLAQAIAALPEREQAARRGGHHRHPARVIARILVNYGRWRELGFMPTLGSYEARPSSPVARCASRRRRHRYLEGGHRRRRARPPSSSAPPTTPSPPARPTSW